MTTVEKTTKKMPLAMRGHIAARNYLVRNGLRIVEDGYSCDQGEVDFVASKRDERLYVQVCQSVLDEGTYQRETAPLEAVGDSFPKLLLVGDRWRLGVTKSGVRIANVVDWLLG